MSKRALLSCLFLLLAGFLLCSPAQADTWYVRADGGTRAQCDGKTDAAAGHGHHCALNDVRALWDNHEYNKLHWVIAGGDTVIIDNTKQWRIGWEGDGRDRHSEPWCIGSDGGPYGCFNPTIPAGTAEKHTRILGRNYEHCSVGNDPDKSKMTHIFGGHGAGTTLNLSGAQFVDVQCLELTRHSVCVRHGDPALPRFCNTDTPLDDYDGEGITTDTSTHDVLLQDLWIHGHTDRGIIGPIGGEITSNRVDISTNGMAGWDFDNGSGTPSVHGVLRMNYTTIEWSGCNQEYPAVHPNPVLNCYGQSNGGYGDGIGTPAKFGMDVFIDHSVFRYNVQDGEDFGHVDTGTNKLSITNSIAYGNGGGQFKWGPNFTHVVFANNLVLGNCIRMSQPMPGVVSTFNAHLGDYCRAEDAVSFGFRQGGTVLFDNNTIVSYSPTTIDVGCGDPSCSASTFVFRNNIMLGYDNPGTYNLGGREGGPGGFYYEKPVGNIKRANNVIYGFRNVKCVATEICKDPRFVGQPRYAHESDLDNFNFHLSPDSPARNAGVPIPDLHTDYDGKPRSASGKFTIGALQ